MPVSSGGDSDWNWLTAIGAGLQSAGAAHFGNFNVPQQYLQLKAEADRRKQEYAMQQAKMAEDKRNHQWSQVFQTLSNEHLGAPQRIEVLKSLKDNPFAAEAAQSVNAKMIGDFKAAGEYLPRKPEEYAKALQDGTIDWHQVAAETKMGLKLKEQVAEKQASVLAYKTLERMAREQPDNEPIQEAFREAQAEKQKKIADANVAVASAPSEIRNNQLKPDLTQSQIDKNRHEGGDWTKRASSLAQGMYGVSPNQITADQVNSQEDVQRASQMGLTIQPGAPRFATLAKMSEIEVPERVAEAGARAREQVKVETNLAPGVMMLDTLSKLTEKPGMFVSEKDGTWQRIKQMAKSRFEAAKGTDDFRLWSQMSDGMRATLARMAMEVGNLAATEQDRALHLIADPYGGLHGLPDSIEVARKKHVLLGEFLKAGLEGPQGPDGQSRVQAKLRSILARLDEVAPLPPIGDVTPAEAQMIESMKAAGKDKRSIQAAILAQRGQQ